MNDTPGWASPGSAHSDGQNGGVPRPAEPADETGPASKWSSEQPPAGQWSAPSGPHHYGAPTPPPGWGGRPPYGGWGPPPAAKPGVIPLRPLGVGEILDGAVSTLRAHWRTVLGITITVSVIAQIFNILVERFLLPDPKEIDPDADPAEALRQSVDSLQSSMVALAPAMLITLIATLFTTALLTVVISRSVLGQPVTLNDAWREARPRLLQLLGLTLLLPLMAAAVMTVAILPGLLLGGDAGAALAILAGVAALPVIAWLMVRFALASPALMLERQNIVPALRRSAKLVQGAWWRTFGILLLTLVLTLLVTMIIAVPFNLIGIAADGNGLGDLLRGRTPDFGWPFLIITGIGSVIAAAITYPVSAGVTVLLYIDQRIRREALDLELARAAGLPGYGSEPPGDGLRS
ncbi:glycerophosphoryl diester phosphodiesterase membrane domain-containing protein [Streptomyces sp. NPDC020965]|uniref:glycerophosphoryl diester phosphodiesterase membrane domain-containing protein n=1 Tax=Streptomyces sp. NPDC020965 TaxID=3365105 RepID=UPI0037904282